MIDRLSTLRRSTPLAVAAVTAAAVSVTGLASAGSLDFTRADFVVGSGANAAGFIIDFNDGNDPVNETRTVYRVHWDTAGYTVTDLFFDVVAADSRLFAKVGTAGSFGTPLFGIGYDTDGDGFGIDDGSIFDANGVLVTNSGNADGAAVTDADDAYREGWFTGFWSQWAGAGNPLNVGDWTLGFGLNAAEVNDGDWVGFGFDQDFSAFSGGLQDAPAFIPSPNAAFAGLAGAALMAARRRRV